MPLITPRLTLFLLPLLSLPVLHATVLHADGIIRVKGDGWRGTRVTVVPEFSQPYDVDMSAPRFVLHLPLQTTYLVRAEHVDCPTKEVVFDLRVPAAGMAQEYEFAFEIILEVQPDGVELRYAGPVGLVSFDKTANDFDYITDHRLIALLPKADELRERAPAELRPQLRASASGSTSDMREPARVVTSVDFEATVPEPLPPARVPTVAPMPVLNELSEAELVKQRIAEPAREVEPASSTLALPSKARTETPSSLHLAPIRAVAVASTHEASTENAPKPMFPIVENRPCGTDETITQGRMVIHIQRVPTADGGCQELRTVTHAYGAVFHFHDGRPVTEAYFNIVSAVH